MGRLWWWCALRPSQAPSASTSGRLKAPSGNIGERRNIGRFTGILPEGDRAGRLRRVCVALDGEPMTCNALDVMARPQLVLTSLLPGKAAPSLDDVLRR